VIGESAPSLAATKLTPPPAPARLVERSRLDDVLDDCVERGVRLVLVCAPAGSGKSTLLASWVGSGPRAAAWLQVEESDSDPARFWSYLVDSVGRGLPEVAAAVKPVVVGSNGDSVAVVDALVTELAERTAPLVVVIDDYHLIRGGDVHRGVERFIDLCPPGVTIVLASRMDPPFRLGRLRVRSQLVEIRAEDLRFDTAEATGLLGAAGLALEAELVAELCERTEGWAAGLVLAGVSLRRASDPAEFVEAFRGDDQLIVGYLSEELLDGVDEDERRRLLETSVLDQLSGPLVDAVAATTDGTAWLHRTARTNQLLVPLDRTSSWYRYHHLLRDLLRLELQTVHPERVADLHRRAAAWFEAESEFGRAIAHWLAADERAAAARLLSVYGVHLLRDGQIETLRSLLVRLGDLAKTSTPCALLYGWCEYIGGRYSLAQEWLDTALAVAPDDFDRIYTTPLAINISLGRGDVANALDLARAMIATDQLSSHPADLATATGAAFVWAGAATEARSALQFALEKAAADDVRSAHVLALVYLAIAELVDGRTDASRSAAQVATATAQQYGLASYHGVAPAYAIRALTADDPERARADAEHALGLVRRVSTPLALGFVLTTCGDRLLALGDDAGRPLLAEARSAIDRCPDPGIAAAYLARIEARHHIAVPTAARTAALVEDLTDRELAVLRYLPSAMSQREISSELFVSLNTVKTHCRAIYRKLGVGDRKSAVQTARELQLL